MGRRNSYQRGEKSLPKGMHGRIPAWKGEVFKGFARERKKISSREEGGRRQEDRAL